MEDQRQQPPPPAPPPSKDGGQLGWGRAVPSLGSVVASAGSWLAALGGGATSGGGGGGGGSGSGGAGEWAAGVVERLLQSVAPGAQQQLLQQLQHGTGAYNKADVRLLQEQCTKQQFGVGRLLRHRFHLFTSGCPELLHDLALLQCRMPAGCVGLADVASQRDFRELLEQGTMPHLGQQQQQRTGGAASDRDVVACLQFFDTIGLWLAKSLVSHGAGESHAGGSSEASSPVPTNVEGVRYFLASLEALSDRQFFAGMACTKLWYLYDLGKLLRLVTNVLYKWNDASLITVLCTAEGFPDMWALLKLTKRFSEKLQQLALPPEYAHAFQAFSILHKLTLTYPATSLSTFKFAFDLTMERMEFLNADPAHFHFSEAWGCPVLPSSREGEGDGAGAERVLGSGADGLVRRMVYRGKSYAVKSIYPFYDKQTSAQPKARSTAPLLSRLSRFSPFPDRLMSARAKAREKRRAKGGADEPLIDYVGLEYMKKIEKLAGEERRDDFWRWLYAQLGEYITMLALPRPSFVKLYCAYVGSLPPPPRYYCPQCFQTKFEDTGPLCDQCSTPLTETYYGEEGLHLVLEYCAEGSLRSHLDREIVAVATAHRADETRSRQRGHREGNEAAAAAEVVAEEEAAEKKEGLEAEGASQECGFWGTQLPENEVTDFLCQLLAGLAYHHARGVVHEDLKPDNILMRDRHTLCLGDFGLASFTSAKSSSSGNHGSPNYNPPELNSGQPLPADYDYTKKDVWAAGLIGLEMFGFKIPVRNVARAIDTISLSPTSLGLRRALALMLQLDPSKRGSALACLMELEAGRKSFAGPTHPQSPPAGSVNSPLPHAIDHIPEGVMEHMALVLDSYQLLDDPDQTISLMMDDKTQPLYADYTQGVEACCKFYLGLLDSSSPRMQEMCCAHLGRLASNERWRSLVIEMQAIGRLTAVIFAAATPPDLRLTIANIFLALMQLTPQGECRAALEQLVALDVLPRLVGLVKTSRSTLLHSSVLHLLRCSFLAGLPAAYYEKTMHAELCRLLAVVGCPSLEHKAFAMQCLQHALLAYPHLVFADHLFAMMDLYHAASLALDRVKEICRMRNRDLPLPAIRIFAEGVLQLLRQSPSSSSPPSGTPSSSPGSGAEAAEWLCGQLDVEGFVGDEANQRLANDVWIDLATHSVTLRRLKGVLKAILRSYELIEAFYRTAEFPVECAGCGGRICLSCVNLCQACHHAHAPIKDRGYWKHKRDHYRSMVAISKQPNARVLQLLQLYPAADKPTLHPHFMEPTGVVRGHRCVRCRRRMAFSLPASHLATCTACGWTFCHACGIEWGDQDTNNEARAARCCHRQQPQQQPAAEAAEDGYHSFVRSVERISLPPLSSSEYHVMMRLLFRFSGVGPAAALAFVDEDQGAASPPDGAAATTTTTTAGGGGGGGGGAGCCHHPLFSLPHVASVPLRCSQCRVNVSSSSGSSSGGSEEGVNSLQAGALGGSCQHLLCRSCLLETCLKQIATGRLVATADSFYAITCPVGRCGGTLLSDALAIKQVVPHEFYELYLGVAALLSAKRPLSFALCKYCARKCALTWEGKLLCWTCSSPKTRRSCQEKEGWLSEKTRDGWSRRYFLAGGADGSLVCAKEPLHQMRGRGGEGIPRVVARLRHLTVRDLSNHPAHRYVFAVIVHHHPATPVELLLAADSLREKTEWMETLASWSPSADPRLGGGGGGVPLA